MRRFLVPLAIAVLALGLGGCASGTPGEGAATTKETPISEEAAPASSVIILDVRTPEEFAEGHLEGAQNIDFNAGAVPAALENLDPDAEYIVYCRSGNRSGQVTALMEQAGFSNVTDLGPLQNAADQTGTPIVTGE